MRKTARGSLQMLRVVAVLTTFCALQCPAQGRSVVSFSEKLQTRAVTAASARRRYEGLLSIRGGSSVRYIEEVADFDRLISEVGDGLLVVDFSAEWCGPCKVDGVLQLPVLRVMTYFVTNA
jgi:thiol-disulfide isomerase/thioredoxin